MSRDWNEELLAVRAELVETLRALTADAPTADIWQLLTDGIAELTALRIRLFEAAAGLETPDPVEELLLDARWAELPPPAD